MPPRRRGDSLQGAMIGLDDAAAVVEAGGKARSLARARAAGLPVLPGVVVLPDEEVDPGELAAALARLGGGRFAVRSSATVEDLAGASAAGVFESVVGVAASGVAEAIERVRSSLHAQAARAYLGARGLLGRRLAMAVLIQPLAPAARLGVLHTAPRVEGALLAEERAAGMPEHGAVAPRRVEPGEPLALLSAKVVALLGAEADLEYALGPEGPILLQARPLTAPGPAREPGRWPLPPGSWRLDAEHNPQPLSAAQASLVARAATVPGLAEQRVVHGWLFVRAAADRPGSGDPGDVATQAGAPAPVEEALATVAARAEARLAPLEAEAAPALEAALAAFDEVVRLHGAELRPVLRAARADVDRLLRRALGEPLAAHGELLAGCGGRTLLRDQSLWRLGRAADEAQRLALLEGHRRDSGFHAPAWDVAVAPDDEDEARTLGAAAMVARGPSPEALHAEAEARAAAAARRLGERLLAPARARFEALLPSLRAAVRAAEDDDALFFRAQRLVRRALLHLGREAARAGRLDDAGQVFELPIEEVALGAIDAGRARGLRALRQAQARLNPPSEVEDGVASWRGGVGASALAGVGTSGRGYGRALVIRDPAQLPAALPVGAVLVLPAVLPSVTWLLPGAAALVTDEGGALSHGATLAREYGVPAVLGTGVATTTLIDGEDLIVDADHGRVLRLRPP